MTAYDLAQPWIAYAVEGLALWRLRVRLGTREVWLHGEEVCALCWGVETERVTRESVRGLLGARQKRQRRIGWQDVAGGALGLSYGLPGRATAIGELLGRVGLEVVESEVSDGEDDDGGARGAPVANRGGPRVDAGGGRASRGGRAGGRPRRASHLRVVR